MKYGTLKLALSIAAAGCAPLFAAQTLETFDDLGAVNAYFAGTWEANDSLTGTTFPAPGLTQGSGVFTIAGEGVSNDADSFLELHFATPVDLGANDAIAVIRNRDVSGTDPPIA